MHQHQCTDVASDRRLPAAAVCTNDELSSKLLGQALQKTVVQRAKESKQILECFQDSDRQLLLVEGPSGAGKTSLIQNTLSAHVTSGGGYVLVGKYDPLQRPEPYVGFSSAFSQFVKQVVQNGKVKTVRQALVDAGVGEKDWKVLAGMIPMLHHIFLDGTPDQSEIDQRTSHRQPDGAMKRFAYVFLMFLRAISSLEVPIVLLLDDLHFADPCSMQILSNIVADLPNCPNLFVVVAYEGDNKLGFVQDALEKICETSCNNGTRVSVGNLGQDEVAKLLADALDVSCSAVSAELTSLVFNQTHGNLFYIMEFIKYLLANNFLSTASVSTGWTIDSQAVKESITTCRVSDFLMLKLGLLSPKLQEFLKVASCCGTRVPIYLLACMYGEQTYPLLEEAAEMELLKQDHVTNIFSFPHDIVQQVVYEMIPVDERASFHLEIGRCMWKSMKAGDLERSLYVLISQFFFAKQLVKDQKERCDLAQLSLLAGRKAAASSTFRTACVYLNLGIELLGDCGWRDHYQLSLALYNAAAEMHLCVADFDGMERLVEVVLKESRPGDRIQAEATRIYALGMSNKQNEALDLGIQLLARLGECFPRRLCLAHVLMEAASVRKRLLGKSDEELQCLPKMEDPKKLACIQVLNLMFLHTLLVRPKLTPFVALKFVSLTLQYGQCLLSPQAFSVYGMILVRIGQIDEGFRFGQLGIKMLERSGHDESLPRVYAAFYGAIYTVKRPVSEAVGKLHEGYRVGLQTGDFEFASLNANIFLLSSLDAGVPLPIIEKEYVRITSVMTALGQETMLQFSKPTVQAIHHYMGLTDDPLGSKGDIFDFEECYRHCVQNNIGYMVVGIIVHRLTLSCIFNDFAGAAIHALRCMGALHDMATIGEQALVFFYCSITFLENASNNFWKKQTALRFARRAATALKKISLACPLNYSHVRLLLDAEVAAAKGRETAAYELYVCSIGCAKSCLSLAMEAFANERCGRFLYKVKRLEEARSHLEEACRAYERWGGMAKVIRLRVEIDSLFGTKPGV